MRAATSRAVTSPAKSLEVQSPRTAKRRRARNRKHPKAGLDTPPAHQKLCWFLHWLKAKFHLLPLLDLSANVLHFTSDQRFNRSHSDMPIVLLQILADVEYFCSQFQQVAFWRVYLASFQHVRLGLDQFFPAPKARIKFQPIDMVAAKVNRSLASYQDMRTLIRHIERTVSYPLVDA